VVQVVQPGELWIADRNFCTIDFLFGIARRGSSFVIRQHQATLHIEWLGERRPCGRVETGAVFEQEIRLSDGAGQVMLARRITVELDQPTRDGETEVSILTNLPSEVADARTIAGLYPGPPHQDSESSWIGRARLHTTGRPTEITRPAFEGSPPCPAASPPRSKTTSTTSRTRASSGPESIP
jgi:hypothetical protein